MKKFDSLTWLIPTLTLWSRPQILEHTHATPVIQTIPTNK